MQFFKYQGAGNDFILVDQRQRQTLGRNDTQKIGFLCDRHFGIGADGLILLQNHPVLDFEMVYFNADGRESTMCGNGGRCIAAFAKHLGIQSGVAAYRFMAIDGEHRAILPHSAGPGGEWVELKMNDVNHVEQVPDADRPAFILNTGSPHFVRFVPDIDILEIKQEGRAVRYSERFKREGINVNFVRENGGALLIRTYERGVEDETLACGTGVTAAAISAYLNNKKAPGQQEVRVSARGGDLLVRFTPLENGTFSDIWLCGPAQKVFQGNIEI